MTAIDLNLLVVLDALLTEGSVTRAAERLALSPSAMSRSLARLRASTGDPLLVRAGQALVPTPLALELRDKIRHVLEGAQAILQPTAQLDLANLERRFIIKANSGFIECFGARLLALIETEAERVRIQFTPKPNKNVTALREGAVDIEIGVVGDAGPEVRIQTLFRDRFIGVVRAGHPLADTAITPERYAAFKHISVSRRGQEHGPIDQALHDLELRRMVRIVVPGFSAALALARELIANVPERQTQAARAGMLSFPLPVPTPELIVSQIWHPRFEHDPAHRWLRGCLRKVCEQEL